MCGHRQEDDDLPSPGRPVRSKALNRINRIKGDTKLERPPNPDLEQARARSAPLLDLEEETLLEVTKISDKKPLPHLLPPGSRLKNHYVIDTVLGEGGMGVVYRAKDQIRERTVAIKALHTNLLGDMGIRKRFVREAKVMTQWTHNNVVAVYDFIEEPQILAIVMEYVDGPSLQQHLKEWGGQMPLREIRQLFSDVLEPMAEAHTEGIVHRDLKPDNILLAHGEDRLVPKIVDFGVAKVLAGTRYTVTGTLLGTCRYMSPEQIQSSPFLDHRSDIYSLGVTLYQLVTGRCPFEAETHWATMRAHISDPVPSPAELRPGIPEKMEALLFALLAKNPDDRPQDCEEVQHLLDEAIGDRPAHRNPSVDLPPAVAETDGATLILVPSGKFLMGRERREVYLDAFYIDEVPVTNRQFAQFLDVTGYRPIDGEAHRFLLHWRRGVIPTGQEDHPVVFVSRQDAVAYATWAGKRLPTEAEWEKSARGTDGRRYPWGKEQPEPFHANFGRRSNGTDRVGSYPKGASPYGVLDLAGNIWEWCQDVDDSEFYENGPVHNPRNCRRTKESRFVIRGGSWLYDAKTMRTFARSSLEPDSRVSGLGFRCAKSAH